jgi:hypothetical protein
MPCDRQILCATKCEKLSDVPLFWDTIHHPRPLIYDARFQSCRAIPHEQQEALIEAVLALACRQTIDEERGGDHAKAGIPASA